MNLRSMFYDALRAAPLYPRRWAGFAAFLLAIAISEAMFGWQGPFTLFVLLAMILALAAAGRGVGRMVLAVLAVMLLAAGCAYVMVAWSAALLVLASFVIFWGATGMWLFREVMPPFTTRGMVERRGDREQRAGGVASPWDLAERSSRAAMRLRAVVMRPSLQGTPRRKVDPWGVASQAAVLDGVRGARGVTRHIREVWVICRDATLRVGGPGTGKTLSLARIAARAPGALLTTSTRLDLAELVQEARAWTRVYGRRTFWQWLRSKPLPLVVEYPRAVHVFNPTGYGNVPSTVRWSILVDCQDYSTAIRRVADMIAESPDPQGERWDEQARLYLPPLLNAGAVGERGVEDVVRWVRELGSDNTMDKARREIAGILGANPDALERVGLVKQLVSINDKTRSSITSTMVKALAWVSDDVARQIGAAPLDTVTLDIRRLILNQETLHIVGPDSGGGMIRPLVSALVAEIAHQVRMLAAEMPGERLDPPLTMALDEIAVAVHLPLDQWSADMGGRGIALHMAVQSLSQLTERWGKFGAQTLLGNVGTLLLYGGGKDADELARISELCGVRYREIIGGAGEDYDGDGHRWDKVPVFSPADLSNLPPFHAVVLQRNLGGAVLGRTPTVLEDGLTRLSLLVDNTTLVGEVVAEGSGVAALLPKLSGGEAIA